MTLIKNLKLSIHSDDVSLDIYRLPDIICNLCLYAFFALTLVIFLYSYNHALFLTRIGFMALGALLSFWWCLTKTKQYSKPLLLTFFVSICWIYCVIWQPATNYPLKDLVYTLCYLWLSLLLIKGDYSHSATVLIFFMGIGLMLLRIYQGASFGSHQGLLLANSRNYISVLVLLFVLFYYISCHDKNREISILPAVVFFVISILAVGRGGILTSSFLLLSLMSYQYNKIEDSRKKFFFKGVFIVTGILLAMGLIFITGIITGAFQQYSEALFSRFYEQGGVDESRLVIWSKFLLNNMNSFAEFLFGSDSRLARYDGNLHSSFFQIYASLGLIGFITYIFLIIKAYVQGIRNKDILWLILFSTLLLRASTDRVFFQGYCEIFFYYFIFYWEFRREDTAV